MAKLFEHEVQIIQQHVALRAAGHDVDVENEIADIERRIRNRLENDIFAEEASEHLWKIAQAEAPAYNSFGRANPFDKKILRKWLLDGMQSELLGRPIETLEDALEHATAMCALWSSDDKIDTKHEAAMVRDRTKEQSRIEWKDAVQWRKGMIEEMDNVVAKLKDRYRRARGLDSLD